MTGVLPGMKIQEKAMRIQKPAPILNMPEDPMRPKRALLQKLPTNNTDAATRCSLSSRF
jgi:hypothetical protein